MTAVRPSSLRVLHIGKFYPPYRGGMESYLADLVVQQRQQGVDARVLVHGTPLGDDPSWVVRVPVQFRFSYAPVALGFARAIWRAVLEQRPDVLHLHMPNNAVLWCLVLASARRLPWVVHWHSDVLTDRMPVWLRAVFRVYALFEQAVLAHAQAVVVTSPPYLQASEPLRRWHDKCWVVPLGLGGAAVPLSSPVPAEDGAQALSESWLPGRLRLLSVGRLTYYKNFETLIRAVAGDASLSLVIAGDGELMASLRALVDTLCPDATARNVVLLGPVSETQKQSLFRDCDVFCLASHERTEAFGMVLLEAMVQGKPCVVSDLPGSGMPWVVESSVAGWAHLPPHDPQAWRKFLVELAALPMADLAERGMNGKAAFQNRFSIEAGATVMTQMYTALTERPVVLPDDHVPSPKDTLIVIPAKDEAQTLGALLRELKVAGWSNVLVVDDHSSDGTGDLAAAEGAMVARPVLPLGAWGGMQLGIRWAYRHGFARVITMDADGQHEVDELPQLLDAAAGIDVVIGAFPERASRLRRIAWRWFQLLTGLKITDLTSGFRCYNHRAVAILAGEEATLLDYQDVGTLLLLRQAGLTMAEVQVSMNARTVGVSRIFSSWLRVARYMAVTTVLCVSRPYVRTGR